MVEDSVAGGIAASEGESTHASEYRGKAQFLGSCSIARREQWEMKAVAELPLL